MKIEDIELPSNRKFGLLFVVIFGGVALYFAWHSSKLFALIFGAGACLTLTVTAVRPQMLLPFNRLWMRFGFLLGRIISPIVLGLLFFVLFSPIGLIMRLTGRDELRLKRGDRDTYWKTRDPVGPKPDSFKHQY